MAAPSGAPAALDVITMGRCSIDLYGQQIGSRLEDVGSFAKSVGGSPSNIAIGTARLGLRSALITRVGDEQMGRFVLEQMAREGSPIAASTRVRRWRAPLPERSRFPLELAYSGAVAKRWPSRAWVAPSAP